MRSQKYKKFFSFIMLGLIVFSTINSFNQPIEISSKEEKESNSENIKNSALVAGTLDMNTIRFSHIKGTINCKMRITFNSLDIQDAYDNEMAHLYTMSSIPSGIVRRVETGLSLDNVIAYSEFSYNEINDGGYGQSFECYTNEYLLAYSTVHPDVYDDNTTSGNTIKEMYYTQTQGTSQSSWELISLVWDLYPILSIDSDFYNFDNIRVKVYDKVIASWTEFDPSDIVLSCPEYKLRIYDKNTNNLIFEDTTYQYFKFYRTITIDSIKLTNDYEEPVIFKLTGSNSLNQQVNPFSSIPLKNNGYTAYTVEDLYNNVLDTGGSVSTGDNLIFTPPYGEMCQIDIKDQNGNYLDFENFNVYIDDVLINSETFYAERDSQVNIKIKTLQNGLLNNTDHTVLTGTNYISFTIDTLYIQNNAAEPINTSIRENGHYKGAYSFDLDEVNTQPEDWVDISGDGCLTYISNEVDRHNKVLTLDDQGGATRIDIRYDITPQTSGNIHHWIRTTDKTKLFQFNWGDGFTVAIDFQIIAGEIQYYTAGAWHTLQAINNNQWYLISIVNMSVSTDIYDIWLDGVEKQTDIAFENAVVEIDKFRGITSNADSRYQIHIDALDFSWSEGYYEGRNQELNTSEELWSWDAFPEWESGHYQETVYMGTVNNPDLSDWTLATDSSDIVNYEGHKNVFRSIEATATNKRNYLPFLIQTEGYIEAFVVENDVRSVYAIYNSGTACVYMIVRPTSIILYYGNGVGGSSTTIVTVDGWAHIKLYFDCATDTYSAWIDDVLKINDENFFADRTATTLNRIYIGSADTSGACEEYIDALASSWDDNYFSGMNTLENTTTLKFPMETNYTSQINPYSSVLTNYTVSNYLVGITDLYSNTLEVQSLSNSSEDNEIIYTPPNVRTCLISLSDQRSNWLNWQNYRIKINGTALYEQYFYREIGEIVNISIYDRFDYYLTSQVYTVKRDDNFINIQLTLHSLKIFNQQELFNFVNITRDPNYYDTSEYWSEWMAPGEIIEYMLYAGYYKVNITSNENSTYTVYSYTLNGDDMLLLTSQHTLTNTIYNIANVNSTIGNQITNVEINITNQNSEINASIVNVEINLTNVNSTIGDMLIAQNTTINAIGNNLTTLYIYSQSSFNILNNSINTTFAQLNTSIYLINNSIYTAVSAVEANLNNINNTISGNLTMILQLNEELTSLFINTMFARYLDWTNATIDSNYIYNQTEYVSILNEYNNESLEIFFKYQTEIESLILSAQDTLLQLIPNQNVTYRWKSLATGEYLTEWEEIPENNTISYGMFEDTYIESDLIISGVSSADFILVIVIISAMSIFMFYTMRKTKAINADKIKKGIYKEKKYSTGQSNPLNSMRNKKG